MTVRVDLLSMEESVDDAVGAPVYLHAPHDEALDLVHVEALVDPADQQALGRVALRAHLSMLTLHDLLGRRDQREHAESRLGEDARPRRGPGVNTRLGAGLEMLPARLARAHPAAPRSPKRA